MKCFRSSDELGTARWTVRCRSLCVPRKGIAYVCIEAHNIIVNANTSSVVLALWCRVSGQHRGRNGEIIIIFLFVVVMDSPARDGVR